MVSARAAHPEQFGSLYNRGAKTTVGVLDVAELEIEGGGRVRLTVENASPAAMKRLGELFEVLATVARPGKDTSVELDIAEPDETCLLIKALNFLHVWWARRPLTPSRAAILASLSPPDVTPERFLRQLGIEQRVGKIDHGIRHGLRVAAVAQCDPAEARQLGNSLGRDRQPQDHLSKAAQGGRWAGIGPPFSGLRSSPDGNASPSVEGDDLKGDDRLVNTSPSRRLLVAPWLGLEGSIAGD